MEECIMDMSFIGNFYDGFSGKYPNVELIGTFYNFIDMLGAKKINKDKVDGRLESMKMTFNRLNREQIIISEPFFEIIKENYPGIREGRTLYKREEEDFLPMMTLILDQGKNVTQAIKDFIVKYSEFSYQQKIKQIKDFTKFTTKFKNEIMSEGNDINEVSNWIPKVTNILKNVIHSYATKDNYLPSNFEPDMDSFSVASCELFIKSMAMFLQNQAGSLSPGLNDNIDLLTLLYVRNGRKLLMRDDKWTGIIQQLGLAEKFLHPYE